MESGRERSERQDCISTHLPNYPDLPSWSVPAFAVSWLMFCPLCKRRGWDNPYNCPHTEPVEEWNEHEEAGVGGRVLAVEILPQYLVWVCASKWERVPRTIRTVNTQPALTLCRVGFGHLYSTLRGSAPSLFSFYTSCEQ